MSQLVNYIILQITYCVFDKDPEKVFKWGRNLTTYAFQFLIIIHNKRWYTDRPFWTLSQSRKTSSPPRQLPAFLSIRQIFSSAVLGAPKRREDQKSKEKKSFLVHLSSYTLSASDCLWQSLDLASLLRLQNLPLKLRPSHLLWWPYTGTGAMEQKTLS